MPFRNVGGRNLGFKFVDKAAVVDALRTISKIDDMRETLKSYLKYSYLNTIQTNLPFRLKIMCFCTLAPTRSDAVRIASTHTGSLHGALN